MAKVNFFFEPDPDRGAPFRILSPTLDMTRVPSVGEVINLGNDEAGVSADYQVVLVVHAPLRPSGIDAEVYGKRVFLAGAITAAAEVAVKHEPPSTEPPALWKAK